MDRPATLTVVTGLPRSGTSMLMQMLSAGGMTVVTDRARPADEDNPRGYFEHARVRSLAADAAWLGDQEGSAVKIVTALLRYLPAEIRCEVLFLERDLDEVLASQAAMLARSGARGASLEQGRLKEVFAKQVQQAKNLLASRPLTTVLPLRHRDVVLSPRAESQRINQFLSHELDEDAMSRVVDASLYRNRA